MSLPSPFRLRRDQSALLVVDVQEKLVPAMFEAERVVRNCSILAQTARLLDVPIVVTEQNSAKLGKTVAPLAAALGDYSPHEKMLFSACTPPVLDEIRASGRNSVVLCGLETHVCVLQTALDLLDSGFSVFVPANAVSSRYESDKSAALSRLGSSGAVSSSTEMLVLEWLRSADHRHFKTVLSLIK